MEKCTAYRVKLGQTLNLAILVFIEEKIILCDGENAIVAAVRVDLIQAKVRDACSSTTKHMDTPASASIRVTCANDGHTGKRALRIKEW